MMSCDPTSDESPPLTADIRHGAREKLNLTLRSYFSFPKSPRLWMTGDPVTGIGRFFPDGWTQPTSALWIVNEC